MKNKKLTAIDVANYFLILVDRKAGDSITHLKLQQLLYFAQGTSLALTGKKLFDEPLIIWQGHIIVKSVYDKFKIFNEKPIPAEIELFDNDAR